MDPAVTSRYQAVAHQTNCIIRTGAGLADGVATELPHGCPYKGRKPCPSTLGTKLERFAGSQSRAVPGTIECRGPKEGSGPGVINMHAQWELGKSLEYNRIPCPNAYGEDSAETRIKWSLACLDKIGRLRDSDAFSSIAFPFKVGCRMAGGGWSRDYEAFE